MLSTVTAAEFQYRLDATVRDRELAIARKIRARFEPVAPARPAHVAQIRPWPRQIRLHAQPV